MGSQPQPVNWAARISGAAALLLNGVPPLLMAFGIIEWSADQMAAYQAFVGGVVVAAIGVLLGQRASAKVTPVESPQDNDFVPLVPVANDGFED